MFLVGNVGVFWWMTLLVYPMVIITSPLPSPSILESCNSKSNSSNFNNEKEDDRFCCICLGPLEIGTEMSVADFSFNVSIPKRFVKSSDYNFSITSLEPSNNTLSNNSSSSIHERRFIARIGNIDFEFELISGQNEDGEEDGEEDDGEDGDENENEDFEDDENENEDFEDDENEDFEDQNEMILEDAFALEESQNEQNNPNQIIESESESESFIINDNYLNLTVSFQMTCSHRDFHQNCLNTWLKSKLADYGSNITCPLCRSVIINNGSRLFEKIDFGGNSNFDDIDRFLVFLLVLGVSSEDVISNVRSIFSNLEFSINLNQPSSEESEESEMLQESEGF